MSKALEKRENTVSVKTSSFSELYAEELLRIY